MERYGRILVIGMADPDRHGKTRVKGRCDCGTEKTFGLQELKSKKTTSCGCFKRELMTSHGLGGSPEYHVWWNMNRRCYNASDDSFHEYGGRGISVCERWRESVTAFYQDMGPRPEGGTLDRINNDGNYEPGNCRWATEEEQRNNKRTSRLITFGGCTLTLNQWSRRTGINRHTIRHRINRGWPKERWFNAVR